MVWNQGSSMNISCKTQEIEAPQGNIFEFFLLAAFYPSTFDCCFIICCLIVAYFTIFERMSEIQVSRSLEDAFSTFFLTAEVVLVPFAGCRKVLRKCLPRYSQSYIVNGKFNPKMDTIRASLSKIRTLFVDIQKGHGRPPSPPKLRVCVCG